MPSSGDDGLMEESERPVTIVTGGGRGIGATVVERLASIGHAVVIGYQRDEVSAARVAATASLAGAPCMALRADVTSEEDVQRLFAGAVERFGTTGLVNNAGLTAYIGDLADTAEVIRRVIDVNLLGVVLCARQAAQVMARRRGGRGGAIVNVSSAAATLGSPHEYVHYAATKAGVDAFTVGLARELAGDDVRVNAVAPGIVRTGIHAAAGDPGRADRLAERIPLGRAADPEEMTQKRSPPRSLGY